MPQPPATPLLAPSDRALHAGPSAPSASSTPSESRPSGADPAPAPSSAPSAPAPSAAHPAQQPSSATPPPDAELDHAAGVLKLLGDRTRLAILAMLHEQPMTVTAIAQALHRPLPGISQHLAKLRAAGLVTATREGTSIRYAQPDAHLAALVTNALHLAEHALYEQPPHHR